MQKILTAGNTKIVKGEELGYLTKGIHFSPADKSGHEVCNVGDPKVAQRLVSIRQGVGKCNSRKIHALPRQKDFLKIALLSWLNLLLRLATQLSLQLKRKWLRSSVQTLQAIWLGKISIRATARQSWSSTPKLNFMIIRRSFGRMAKFLNGDFPSNYHLTFSRSEHNETLCDMVLEMGGNVAVVFRDQLPATWKGFEVVNGDANDLRFLDKSGVVVGLIEKGLAKKDETGFVQEGINSWAWKNTKKPVFNENGRQK